MGTLYDQASVTLVNKLKQSLDINSSVRCIAEWNQNRYSEILSVENTGTDPLDEFDNDLFPISSIAKGERPKRGVLKGWVSDRTAGGADGYVRSGYEDQPRAARYVTAHDDAVYKYWTSPTQSAASSPYAISGVVPTVIYKNATWANKIRIGFENSYASPTTYTVSVTTDGTTWSVVATSPAIGSDGTVNLYRQANGTWGTTVYRDNPQQIRGVRVTVTNMNKGLVHFNLIELGARIESDVSQFIQSYNVDYTMSEVSFAAPIGRASSNTGNIVLDNTDGRFTNDNPSSLYYNLLDKNVEFRLDVGINNGTMAAPSWEYVRQLTMRSESWDGQTPEGTTVQVKDASDYLQSIKGAPMLLEAVTVGEIIWRLLDSVGFSDWKYEVADDDPSTLVPYFWYNGEDTIWEAIAKIAEATQTAVYFDAFGILQIQTRSKAYNLTSPVTWTLDATTNGSKQADIVEMEKEYDYEANVVNVIYKPTSIAQVSPSGVPTMEVVWEPEDTVTLRASKLKANMNAPTGSLVISPTDAAVWPYEGMVQIEGEFIRYSGKSYTYYNAAGSKVSKYIKSNDEKIALDKLNPAKAYLNMFNGYFAVTERGAWNTTPKAHVIDISGWTYNRVRTGGGSAYFWNGGLIHNRERSSVTLRTNKTFTPNSWYVCTRGSRNDSPPYWYGTRFKFDPSGYTYGAAGIAFSVGDLDSGWFCEVVRTAAISTTDRAKYTHELCFYIKYENGTIKRFGPDGGKGVPVSITPGIWYDLDVHFEWQGSTRVVTMALNGITKLVASVPTGSGPGESVGGRYGLFTRGFTSAEFEYIYASTYSVNDTFDDEGWWDRIKSGYQSNQWDREWTYGYRWNTKINGGKSRKVYSRYGSRLMDEFGPIVHEVREYDVDFSKTPVLNSNIYLSNDSQVICPQYNGNPFGAKFILANTSRLNAVVNGEDSITYGIDNTLEQKLLVYGRTFTQDEEETETVRDEQGIKRRGEVSLDIQSEWIQTEAAAKSLGQWIIKHWSGGADEVTAEIFGNPLIAVGDIVEVNNVYRNMAAATHKYFVVAVNHSYETGLETKLTLRRRKI